MTISKSKRLLIRLFSIVVAAGCFIEAYEFFDGAMSYMGEMFDNSHSSATMMGTKINHEDFNNLIHRKAYLPGYIGQITIVPERDAAVVAASTSGQAAGAAKELIAKLPEEFAAKK